MVLLDNSDEVKYVGDHISLHCLCHPNPFSRTQREDSLGYLKEIYNPLSYMVIVAYPLSGWSGF